MIRNLDDHLTASGASIEGAMAVRSGDFKRIWFVSARVGGGANDGEVATWATDEIRKPAGTYSADALAMELSDWKEGPEGSPAGADDSGFQESRDCVE